MDSQSNLLGFVEVKLRLPRSVHDFFRALVEFTGLDLEELLRAELEKTARSIAKELGALSYIDYEGLLYRYGLDSPRDP